MYESPIEKIYGDIQSQIIKQDEEHMMYAVNQAISYTVDKEELIKALQYDREQYAKGYSDCKIDMLAKIEQAKEEIQELINQNIIIDDTTGESMWLTETGEGLENALNILNELIESEKVND